MSKIVSRSKDQFKYSRLRKIYDNWEIVDIPDEAKEVWKVGLNEFIPKNIIHDFLEKSYIIDIENDIAEISISYKHSKLLKTSGRRYVINGIGLQTMFKLIRQTITHDIYHDIDIVSAHINILNQYCQLNNYPHEHLQNACDNNEQQIQEIMKIRNCTREKAKRDRLAQINGGERYVNTPWWFEFKQEIKKIHQLILNDKRNETLLSLIKSDPNRKDKYNLEGRLTNHILCQIEDKILQSCINYLKKHKYDIKNIVLVFDGFMIPINVVNPTETFFNDLSKFVFNETGFKMNFVVKKPNKLIPLDKLQMKDTLEPINPNGGDENIVNGDTDAANKILDSLTNRIFFCQGNIFIKTFEKNIWTSNCQKVDREIVQTCQRLGLRTKTICGTLPFDGNTSNIKNMVYLVKSMCPEDDQFIETMRRKSKGKIFFKDQVYDFTKKEYRKEDDDDMTPVRIPRNAPIHGSDIKIKNNIIEILNSIFKRDDIEKEQLCPEAKNILQYFARTLAGHLEDKNWLIGLGLRNCGKGILTLMTRCAFNGYVTEVDVNNFINKSKQNGSDEAKSKMWLIKHMWSRILFGNEVDIENSKEKAILNGILIKSLSSGGDTQVVRGLYQSEFEFIFAGLIVILLNEVPEIRPSDTCQTLSLFEFPNKYISPEIYDKMVKEQSLDIYMKKGDATLKDKIIESDFCDAFVNLVFEQYIDHKVVNCESVENSSNEYKIDNGDDCLFFKETFVFTMKKEDCMTSKDILNIVRSKFPKMSNQKIKSFLTKNMGLTYTKNLEQKTYDSRVGYIGIKLNENYLISNQEQEKKTGFSDPILNKNCGISKQILYKNHLDEDE
jgi:hypothetical protein